MTNSIMEALNAAPEPITRDALARDLAATCRKAAERNFSEAAKWNATDNKLEGVKSYLKGLEFEKMAACILESVVFQREPEFTREQRQALLRMIATPRPYVQDGKVGFGETMISLYGSVSKDIDLDFDGGEA